MLFKETSLAFTIGVLDMMGKARAVSSANYGATKLEIYIAAGLIFLGVLLFNEKEPGWLKKPIPRAAKHKGGITDEFYLY